MFLEKHYTNSIYALTELEPYGIYYLSEVASTCFGKELAVLFNCTVEEKQKLYKTLSQVPPEFPIRTLEELRINGNRVRHMLVEQTGLYLGAFHEECPELTITKGGCLWTDSEFQGAIYSPEGGAIPKMKLGWRAIYAEAGTIISDYKP